MGDQLNEDVISNGLLSVTDMVTWTGSQYCILAPNILAQWTQIESLTSHMVRTVLNTLIYDFFGTGELFNAQF
jgi:hypothetical protein